MNREVKLPGILITKFSFSFFSEADSIISRCMLSLNSRPMNVSNGTLLVSLSDGRIQVWSHHHKTECNITDFNAIHVAGDVSKWLIDVHSLSSFFVSKACQRVAFMNFKTH